MFEGILEEINGFGYFQILNILLLWTARLVVPCHILLHNFIGVKAHHHCDISLMDDEGRFGNLTEEQKLTVLIPAGEDGKPKSCQMFSEPQFHLLFNSSNSEILPTVQCQSGWVYDNSTFSSTLVTEWDLVCNRKKLSKTINTLFFVGVVMGSLLFGYLSDKFGRRSTLLVSYLMALVFSISSSIANSWIMFAVLRFFTGFSFTGISVNGLVLNVEWVDIRHRSYANFILGLAWSVGSMLLAVLAFLVTDWRKLTMIVTSPLIIGVLSWWWVPESARWLLANGKVDKAKFYLDKCATINKRPKLSKSKVENSRPYGRSLECAQTLRGAGGSDASPVRTSRPGLLGGRAAAGEHLRGQRQPLLRRGTVLPRLGPLHPVRVHRRGLRVRAHRLHVSACIHILYMSFVAVL